MEIYKIHLNIGYIVSKVLSTLVNLLKNVYEIFYIIKIPKKFFTNP